MRKAFLPILFFFLILVSCGSSRHVVGEIQPKREFRGAWIQAVNGQFMGMGEQQMKGYLIEITVFLLSRKRFELINFKISRFRQKFELLNKKWLISAIFAHFIKLA